MSEFIEKYKFNFEFTIDHSPGLPDGDPEGTWHITESDFINEQGIVKAALESQFYDDDKIEVQLYQENGRELTSECTSGHFVAYRGGIPA